MGILDTDLDGVARTGTPGALEGGGSTSHEPSSGKLHFVSNAFASEATSPVTINASWSDDISNTGESGSYITHAVGVQDPIIYRTMAKFSLSSVPDGATITKVELITDITYVTGNGADTYLGGPYNGNGQADPESDTGTTRYSRCDITSDNYLSGDTDFRAIGTYTWDLGSAGVTDVTAAKIAGTPFTVVYKQTDESTGSSHYAVVNGYTQSVPPKLVVYFTTSGTTGEHGLLLIKGGVPLAGGTQTVQDVVAVPIYYPEPPPFNDMDIPRYLYQELLRISMNLEVVTGGNVEQLHVEPDKPRNGMVRLADGTNWNPGSGAGVYAYYNGTWNKLG